MAKKSSSKKISKVESSAAVISDKVMRVQTGIPGLDKLLEGGLPERSVVLLSGSAGTGKTTFCNQFLMHGLRNGENVLYITLEESPDEIKQDAIQYGWNFNEFEKQGHYRIVYYDPFELGEIIRRMTDLVKVNKITRMAIDSVSLFGLFLKDEYKIRQELFKLVDALKETGCTAILCSEIPEGSNLYSRYGVEEFVADGVIVLRYQTVGKGNFRDIEIRKMRRTKHANGSFPLLFTRTGIEVKSL